MTWWQPFSFASFAFAAEPTVPITVTPSAGKPLRFAGGGQILAIRVHGGLAGETFLVMESPALKTATGQNIAAAIGGGRARVR